MMIVWIVITLFAAICLWGIFSYNRLVISRNDVRNAWSQIDIQLKRRHDLIPNLVAAVRGYMEHEKGVLENVVRARAQAVVTGGLQDKARVEDALSGYLKSLFVAIENYPVLKASDNVMRLQEDLVTTENRIAFSRQLYNDLVANYQTSCEIFPDMLIAQVFAFTQFEYFRAERDEKSTPNVLAAQ
jgi:LemA protein